MTQPKFNIGEVVILQHKNHTNLDGEYTVLDIIDRQTFNMENPMWRCNGAYGYDLGVILRHGSGNGSTSKYLGETHLSKKHKPSEDSLSQMMDKLKLGVPV